MGILEPNRVPTFEHGLLQFLAIHRSCSLQPTAEAESCIMMMNGYMNRACDAFGCCDHGRVHCVTISRIVTEVAAMSTCEISNSNPSISTLVEKMYIVLHSSMEEMSLVASQPRPQTHLASLGLSATHLRNPGA